MPTDANAADSLFLAPSVIRSEVCTIALRAVHSVVRCVGIFGHWPDLRLDCISANDTRLAFGLAACPGTSAPRKLAPTQQPTMPSHISLSRPGFAFQSRNFLPCDSTSIAYSDVQ